MVEIRFIPGAVVSPNAITLPVTSPGIEVVSAAQIVRLANGATIPNHLAAAIQASAPINDHAAHGHNITTVVAAGGGGALTDPVIPGPLESAGGGQVNTAAVDVLAAAQAHAFGAGVATVHGASVGANPVVAAVPTKITARTFSLDVDTALGDILTLMYQEVGERVLTS